MRKIEKVIFCGIMILCSASLAHAYMFNDPVNKPWPMTDYDRIGSPVFELFGMDINHVGSNTIVDIYTNYPEEGFLVSSWYTKPGDLALDLDGDNIFEYGLAFTSHGDFSAGTLYSVGEWFKSDDFAPSSSYTYFKDKFVQIKNGQPFSTHSVSWIDNDTGIDPDVPDWRINLVFNDDFMPKSKDDTTHFFYAVATCSNDFMEDTIVDTYNTVPEPATISLLGLGVLGLAGFRKKKKGRI